MVQNNRSKHVCQIKTNASTNRTGLSWHIESSNVLISICNLGMPVT